MMNAILFDISQTPNINSYESGKQISSLELETKKQINETKPVPECNP